MVLVIVLVTMNSCYVYTGSYSSSNDTLARWNTEREVRYERYQRDQILFNQQQQRYREYRQGLNK